MVDIASEFKPNIAERFDAQLIYARRTKRKYIVGTIVCKWKWFDTCIVPETIFGMEKPGEIVTATNTTWTVRTTTHHAHQTKLKFYFSMNFAVLHHRCWPVSRANNSRHNRVQLIKPRNRHRWQMNRQPLHRKSSHRSKKSHRPSCILSTIKVIGPHRAIHEADLHRRHPSEWNNQKISNNSQPPL